MIDTQKIAKSAEHLQAKISVFDTKATLNGEDIGHLHTVLSRCASCVRSPTSPLSCVGW